MAPRAVRVVVVLATAAALAFAIAGCARRREAPPSGVLVVSQEQQGSWVRNFNPLTTATAARWPTMAGIYEPLFVFNSVKGTSVPWLATAREWREGNRVFRVTMRAGVRWSDGQAFTARDVAFTFGLLKRFPALDRRGVWGFLESVKAVDEHTVDFRFKRIFIPGADEIVAQQIVPEHDWSSVKDPVSFANEHPVATGPFTVVKTFENQVYELGRNPDYWQAGLPKLETLRFPAYPGNDRANLALVFDEVDWAGNFVPAIDRVFVNRRPDAHGYWFPLTGSSIFLYANTTRAPFDDVRVRKALSMAIDRELLVDVALYRYSKPADATGLSDAYSTWRDSIAVASGDWVHHDATRAAALLDEAGIKRGADGKRRLPDGKALNYEIYAVSGWSDWVRAAQVIARGLREVGIDATVRTYDFSAWFQRVQEGNFDLTLGWSFEGPTPYTFYQWLMAAATVKPTGEASMGNWHRYGSAAATRALAAFEVEADSLAQHRLCAELQRVFVAEAPAIPLYPNPSWAEYNTARTEGFPSREDPYADASPNKYDRGEVLLVLTRLAPRQVGR
ncbi:MAG: ABC transporter substrate-binding protein [Candidatus Eisenbacteria bacterium]|uniref:ABC transporter substrate-binding protein n=1 Tax=Eiseniibacteriota bacterium TaxID=2212470 RepID=A0A849SF80_UNCEI|nr:ABC transporter substrate-binding protein [Candidatus Eisenbacteria bacterium]